LQHKRGRCFFRSLSVCASPVPQKKNMGLQREQCLMYALLFLRALLSKKWNCLHFVLSMLSMLSISIKNK